MLQAHPQLISVHNGVGAIQEPRGQHPPRSMAPLPLRDGLTQLTRCSVGGGRGGTRGSRRFKGRGWTPPAFWLDKHRQKHAGDSWCLALLLPLSHQPQLKPSAISCRLPPFPPPSRLTPSPEGVLPLLHPCCQPLIVARLRADMGQAGADAGELRPSTLRHHRRSSRRRCCRCGCAVGGGGNGTRAAQRGEVVGPVWFRAAAGAATAGGQLHLQQLQAVAAAAVKAIAARGIRVSTH